MSSASLAIAGDDARHASRQQELDRQLLIQLVVLDQQHAQRAQPLHGLRSCWLCSTWRVLAVAPPPIWRESASNTTEAVTGLVRAPLHQGLVLAQRLVDGFAVETA
jgi:hypothetical protein